MNVAAYSGTARMRLRILLPTDVLVDEPVMKVIAEAENGSFCLLPRHIDFVAALAPGILFFDNDEGIENLAAIDHGILVKCADDVLVSVVNGVRGTDLEHLQSVVQEHFLELDEYDRKSRTALARLEAGTLRIFRELQDRSHA